MSDEPSHGFTHLDARGRAKMVDVGEKDQTRRRAVARAILRASDEVAQALVGEGPNPLEKGDAAAVARVAGIAAAKRCHLLIPLCHQINLTSVQVDIEWLDGVGVEVVAIAEAYDRTGVEMEALVAASTAALTLYDMAKSRERGMTIESIELEEKEGGRSGRWTRAE